MTIQRILVVGAGGAVGLAAVADARAQGLEVIAAFRTRRDGVEGAITSLGARAVQADLKDAAAIKELLQQADAAIFTPILTVSAPAAPLLESDQPAVFLSSNNVAVDPQAAVYARLLAAEKAIRIEAPRAVILRPTMIYGYGGDGNLSSLMNAMARWPVLPLIGRASALQQPIFYKDLAHSCVDTLLAGDKVGTTNAVAGPAPVTKRELYTLAARAAGVSPLVVPVSSVPAAIMLNLIERAGVRLRISAAQLRRANDDKVPHGDRVMLTDTPLTDGLRQLAANNLN